MKTTETIEQPEPRFALLDLSEISFDTEPIEKDEKKVTEP